jgi:hypothetical protein
VRGHGAPARIVRTGRQGTEGERAGDDAHLHMELRQRTGVKERQWSGEMIACPSLAAAAAAARLGFTRQRRRLRFLRILGHGAVAL